MADLDFLLVNSAGPTKTRKKNTELPDIQSCLTKTFGNENNCEKRLELSVVDQVPHTIHPDERKKIRTWMVDFYGFHVGKFTSSMDGMWNRFPDFFLTYDFKQYQLLELLNPLLLYNLKEYIIYVIFNRRTRRLLFSGMSCKRGIRQWSTWKDIEIDCGTKTTAMTCWYLQDGAP